MRQLYKKKKKKNQKEEQLIRELGMRAKRNVTIGSYTYGEAGRKDLFTLEKKIVCYLGVAIEGDICE